MILGIARETIPGERRVALVPDSVQRLAATGLSFWLQTGAGCAAGFSDDAYSKRSMNPGFARVENKLFLRPNTMRLFGDAKQSLGELVRGLKRR
jgi:NAD(P) transhydrogenase subunit alpha